MLSLLIGCMRLLLFVTIFGLDIVLFSLVDCGAIFSFLFLVPGESDYVGLCS